MKNRWIDNPWVDIFFPLLGIAVWLIVFPRPLHDQAFAPTLTALSSAAGLALALVSINMTVLYQSSSPYLSKVLAAHHDALSAIFLWPLLLLVLATLAPILGIVVADPLPMVASGIALGSGTLIAAVLMRLIWSLRLFLGLKRRGDREDKVRTIPKVQLDF